MDNRNFEGVAAIAVILVVLTILKFAIIGIATLALCVTGLFAAVALIAIVNGGVTVNDGYVSAADGKKFFVRGFVGTVALSIFVGLFYTILDEPCPFAPHWVWLAGFVLGSTGMELAEAEEEAEMAKRAEMIVLPPMTEHDFRPLPPATPNVEPVKPFHFASWEDEEQGR